MSFSFDRSKLPIVRFDSSGSFRSNDFVLGPYLTSLKFSRGNEKNVVREFGLEKDEFRISGHPNADESTATVHLDGRIVSRNHASLSWQLKSGNTKPKLYLKDLDSTHGTFVKRFNSSSFQVEPEIDVEIRNGDSITIGRKIEKGEESHFPAVFNVSFEPQDDLEMLSQPVGIIENVEMLGEEIFSLPLKNVSSSSGQIPVLSEKSVKENDNNVVDSSSDEEEQEKSRELKSKLTEVVSLFSEDEDSEKEESEKEDSSDDEYVKYDSEEVEEPSENEDESTDLTDSSSHVNAPKPTAGLYQESITKTKEIPPEDLEGANTHIVVQELRKQLVMEMKEKTEETEEGTVKKKNEAEEEVIIKESAKDEDEDESDNDDESEKCMVLEEEMKSKTLEKVEQSASNDSEIPQIEVSSSSSKTENNAKRSADVAELNVHEPSNKYPRVKQTARKSTEFKSIDEIEAFRRRQARLLVEKTEPVPKRQKIGFGAGLAAGLVFGIVGTIVGLSTIPISDLA